MKTILVDKHNNIINDGDIVTVRCNLSDFPGMYHYGLYKVSFDPLRGLTLTIQDLINDANQNNQLIGTYELRINEHIHLWRCDSKGDNVYCRFNIDGKTFVRIDPSNDIEKIV
jgi:hypothetical protein